MTLDLPGFHAGTSSCGGRTRYRESEVGDPAEDRLEDIATDGDLSHLKCQVTGVPDYLRSDLANAAMKSIERKDTGEDWKEYLRRLAEETMHGQRHLVSAGSRKKRSIVDSSQETKARLTT